MPNGSPAARNLPYTCAAYSVGTCSSQPSSPTYPMRSASTGAEPTVIHRARAYRWELLLKSSSLTRCSTSRDTGPQTLMTARAEVMSRTTTEPSSGEFDRIQPMSCCPKAEPVTTYHESAAVRVNVRSHSIPPCSLHSCVYVTVPTDLSMSATDNRCTAANAPGPVISNLANEVWSMRATRSRMARCAAPTDSNQFGLPNDG